LSWYYIDDTFAFLLAAHYSFCLPVSGNMSQTIQTYAATGIQLVGSSGREIRKNPIFVKQEVTFIMGSTLVDLETMAGILLTIVHLLFPLPLATIMCTTAVRNLYGIKDHMAKDPATTSLLVK